MLRYVFAAGLALAAVMAAGSTSASHRHQTALICSELDQMRGLCLGSARGQRPARLGRALFSRSPAVDTRPRHAHQRGSNRSGGLVGPLAAKVAEIEGACAARLVSGFRHTLIAGTRRLSLHASGKAADMAGDPGCIYSHLAGWAGGYSVDYGRMRHVHISYDPDGGREMGLRFHHGGHRHARRHHVRMASRR